MSRWAVVLAGGVGSRFWPLSTPQQPKQLLPLATTQPLLLDSLERLAPLVPMERVLVLTNAGLVNAISTMVPSLPRENILAEPKAAGTAAALAWAALEVARRGDRCDTMICVHADWAIGDPEAFRTALVRAIDAADQYAALVTVGVTPTRPDPGFGYIQVGHEIERGVFRVARFVEKPDRRRAAEMVEDGFLWNTGIFVWRASDFLDEIAAHTPEVATPMSEHPDDMAAFFGAVHGGLSVDVGLIERSRRVLVVPGTFGWDDVGTWPALRRVRPLDPSGNTLHGPVHVLESAHNIVETDGPRVVLYGVSNLVVVVHQGTVLVTTAERATDLKALLASLPPGDSPTGALP